MLSDLRLSLLVNFSLFVSLNAPYGARCFLTFLKLGSIRERLGLNAPYGARCFLTPRNRGRHGQEDTVVSMHLLALGAF